MKRFFILILLIIVFGCSTEMDKTTDVDVQLKWLHQAQFAGMYAANDLGYYKEKNMNVDLRPFDYKSFPISEVQNKNVDFGITGADELIIAKDKGLADNVKAIAVIFKRNPVVLYSLKDSNIMKPKDLEGKTVGIERAPDGTDINIGFMYKAMIKKLNIDESSINEITIGYDATELLAGETDVSSGYIINEPYFVINDGKEVNTILVADYGVNMYADVIIVHEDTIKSDPTLVQNFVDQTLRGWQYVIENPDEAVDITLNYATESSKEHQSYMISQTIPLIYTGDSKVGLMSEREWNQAQDILFDQGLISKKIPNENLFTNEFIK